MSPIVAFGAILSASLSYYFRHASKFIQGIRSITYVYRLKAKYQYPSFAWFSIWYYHFWNALIVVCTSSYPSSCINLVTSTTLKIEIREEPSSFLSRANGSDDRWRMIRSKHVHRTIRKQNIFTDDQSFLYFSTSYFSRSVFTSHFTRLIYGFDAWMLNTWKLMPYFTVLQHATAAI